MKCDHDALAASLDVFTAGTVIVGVQPDGDGGWLLLGNCYGCNSTRAIPIAMPRGTVVHGEISLAVDDTPPPVRETAEDHARRVIT